MLLMLMMAAIFEVVARRHDVKRRSETKYPRCCCDDLVQEKVQEILIHLRIVKTSK